MLLGDMRLREIFIFSMVCLLGVQAWAEDSALERLVNSPRHQEWVNIEFDGGSIKAFLVFPEVTGKVTAVLVIHENRGLNDWARSVADRLAEEGYLAIAPDLISGMAPDGGGTSDFPTTDDARKAIYELKPDFVTAALNATANYVKAIPPCNGRLAVGGFCWGGSQTFRFATNRGDLSAASVFYGRAPESGIEHIVCPVYGFYGEDDNRINATIPETEKWMKENGKTYDPVIYDGARHAFMRRGETETGEMPNRRAMMSAWQRWLYLLGKI